MKTKIIIWIIIVALSVMTCVFGGAPNNLTEFIYGFILCFFFWGAMLAPSFIAKDK